MDQVDRDTTFNNVDIEDYEVPTLAKLVDARGYIYLLEDTAYPGYIKIGRTINMKKRLAMYNADKPFKSSKLVAISRMFEDAIHAEKKILEYLYNNTAPTTLSREWFQAENTNICLRLITDAEKSFP